MKKENKIRLQIEKTSFQTQLFLIVLFCFIVFVVVEYLVILYSFRRRYIKKEIKSSFQSVEKLALETSGDGNYTGLLYSFTNKNGIIPLTISSSGGGYTIVDSVYSSYRVYLKHQSETYIIEVPTYDFIIERHDLLTGYFKKSEISDSYTPKILSINNEEVLSGNVQNDYTYIYNGLVEQVDIPLNINYLYENSETTEAALVLLDKNIQNFKEMKSSVCSYSSYYLDRDNGYLYFLVKPISFSENDNFILFVSSFVETDSLLSIVSSYYGYIVLGSVLIAVLIALFISRAFSKPIKEIEKEIIKLEKSDYSTSSHEFKNRELISLQQVLNEVKIDTKEKVENIENQREALEKLNQDLIRENDLRSSFISRLSHELKTPLMVISATTEALMSDLIKEEDKEKEYNNILNEVDKTTGIIKDIINTYKTSTNKVEINAERFNLNKLVDEIVTPIMPLSQKNNLSVIKNFEKNEYMYADRSLIGQVISNFVTNAFKYTKENGRVEINIIDKKRSFVFEVKNYGSKISEENLKKIWLPFFREDENVDSISTGMGLYIVKEILTAHKLEFDVTNFSDGVISYFIVNK